MHTEKRLVQFSNTDSILHRIHPLVKFVWLIILSSIIIFSKNPFTQAAVFSLVVGLFIIGHFNIIKINGTRLVFSTAVLIASLQLLFVRTGREVYNFENFVILTTAGIEQAVIVGMRFCSIILLGFIFVLTTNPNEFVYSLMSLGFSYRIGFSLITALRLTSYFSDEIQKIYYSSIIKGVNYKILPVHSFIKSLTNFFKLTLISIIKKVDALSLSMEGRAFGSVDRRTFLRTARLGVIDYGLLIIGLLGFGLLMVFKVHKGQGF